MNSSKLNNWLQLFASCGVLVGLIFVAYEIRENTLLAEATMVETIASGWETISISEYETDISALHAKARTEPENLTRAEIYKLNSYLTAITTQYDRLIELNERGFRSGTELTADPKWQLEDAFNHYLNYPFGRAWYRENRGWMDSAITEVWDPLLERDLDNAEDDFVERIQEQFQ